MPLRFLGSVLLAAALAATACSAAPGASAPPAASAALGSQVARPSSPATTALPARSFLHEADLPTGSPQTPAATSAAASTPTGVDACAVVTKTEVADILGATPGEPEAATAGPGALPNTCSFPDTAGNQLATLAVLSLGDAAGTYATIASDAAHIDRTLTDLGDAAVCTTALLGTVTLYVLLGTRLIEVITEGCDSAEAIARLAVERL